MNEEQKNVLAKIVELAIEHKIEVEVKFKKVNGDDRSILVTPSIPEDKLPKNQITRAQPNVIRVFSKHDNDWRSIRKDSIEGLKIDREDQVDE